MHHTARHHLEGGGDGREDQGGRRAQEGWQGSFTLWFPPDDTIEANPDFSLAFLRSDPLTMSGTIRRERAHQQRLHPRKRRRVVLDRTAPSRSRHLLFLSPPFLCLTLTCCTLRPSSLSTCLFSQQGARVAKASDLAKTESLPGVLQARFLLAQTPNVQHAHLGCTSRPRLHG